MSRILWVFLMSVCLTGTAWAQDHSKPQEEKTGEPVSMVVAMSGIVVVGAGFGMMLHETWRCHDLADGGGLCGTGTDLKWIVAGTVVVAAGVTMTWLGLRSRTVTVAPAVAPHVLGATATIRWGARRRR